MEKYYLFLFNGPKGGMLDYGGAYESVEGAKQRFESMNGQVVIINGSLLVLLTASRSRINKEVMWK